MTPLTSCSLPNSGLQVTRKRMPLPRRLVGDVDAAALDRFQVLGMAGGQPPLPGEDVGQRAAGGRGGVQDHEHRGAEVVGQGPDQPSQRFDPAGRGADDHDVVVSHASLPVPPAASSSASPGRASTTPGYPGPWSEKGRSGTGSSAPPRCCIASLEGPPIAVALTLIRACDQVTRIVLAPPEAA
jgi:hypothetical protein